MSRQGHLSIERMWHLAQVSQAGFFRSLHTPPLARRDGGPVGHSRNRRRTAEFVYLAVVLDAYSRKVVGWALDRTLAARLPIAALKHALAERHPSPGWSTIPIAASSMRPRSM